MIYIRYDTTKIVKCQLTFDAIYDIINIRSYFDRKGDTKMIRHIVMWKFKELAEGRTKEENIAIVREGLHALVGEIDEIKKMETGVDITHSDASMDLVLVTEFESAETLRAYALHPKHLKVAEYVKKVVESRVVLDYDM